MWHDDDMGVKIGKCVKGVKSEVQGHTSNRVETQDVVMEPDTESQSML